VTVTNFLGLNGFNTTTI
jgi:hypothetical protein